MKVAANAVARALARPDPAWRAVLLFGPNRVRVSEAAAELTAKILGAEADALSITRLSDDDLKKDKARLADELAAQSLLGGARLIRLRADGDAAAETILASLSALEAGQPAAAFLLVEGGDLAAKSKIRVAFEGGARCAAMPFYDDEPADLVAFADAALNDAGADLTEGARAQFLDHLPGERSAIRAEIEKLVLFAHDLGRPISEDEVAALGGAEAEGEIDRAVTAALSGDAAAAFTALERSEGEAGVPAVKALERRLMRLLEARAAMAGGVDAAAAAAKLKPALFWKERDAFMTHLRRWSTAKLHAALERTWSTELAAKAAGAAHVALTARLYREIARLASLN